jgi:hypothetical protein
MFIGRVAIAAAAIAAPLAFAAPAMADDMNFACAPCVGDVNGDGKIVPVWNELTELVPGGIWETGVKAVNGGAWENATANGPWEKVFPNPDLTG